MDSASSLSRTDAPAFDFVDMKTWARAADFTFFMQADSQMHICNEVDVGPLCDFTAQHDLRFFHCLAYLAGRCVNGIDDMLLSSIHYPYEDGPRVPIRFHRRDASFPVLNAQGNPVNVTLAFDNDFETFYRRSVACGDAAARNSVNTFTENDAHFLLTYVPLHFSDLGMTSTKMRMQMPAICVGTYRQSAEGLMMPMSVTYPHAFADGMCLVRFYRMFEEACRHPEKSLGRVDFS